MKALPYRYYGDPAECVEEFAELRKVAESRIERQKVTERNNKGRRIRALVKDAMKGVRR